MYGGESNSEVVRVQVIDASVDGQFLITALRVTAAERETVVVDTYHLEYDLSINGGDYRLLGVTQWRHPFGVSDIKTLSGTNAWLRNYYYHLTNIVPASVETIQFRISDKSDNSLPTVHTNIWHGIAETQRYKLKR